MAGLTLSFVQSSENRFVSGFCQEYIIMHNEKPLTLIDSVIDRQMDKSVGSIIDDPAPLKGCKVSKTQDSSKNISENS